MAAALPAALSAVGCTTWQSVHIACRLGAQHCAWHCTSTYIALLCMPSGRLAPCRWIARGALGITLCGLGRTETFEARVMLPSLVLKPYSRSSSGLRLFLIRHWAKCWIAAHNSGLSAAVSPRHSNERLTPPLWWSALRSATFGLCCTLQTVCARVAPSCAAQQQARGFNALCTRTICAWPSARASWLGSVPQHTQTCGTHVCIACVSLGQYDVAVWESTL
jgi:hypothetical protein